MPYFKILPQINNWDKDKKRIKDGFRVDEGFTYCSDNNSEWMTKSELKTWLDNNRDSIGII